MKIAQIYTPGLAQSSYVVGSGKKCVVVDPVRNIEPYLEKAKEFDMEITAILETHLHADFVSGHMELAEETGARIYAPKIANCSFDHYALEDKEDFAIEHLHFQLLETPGHTPESSIYLLTDLERGREPVLAFTGDTLLVGDVGRPDLFPNREEELALKLFHSLQHIKELEDHVEVYPAHGMGSLCGRALSAKLWSTIGTERRYNYALQETELESFKRVLLTSMPSAPDHFARCSEINRQGPPLVGDLPTPYPMEVNEVKRAIEEGQTLLDTRPYHSFAAAHIPNSYSISSHGNLPTFAGWVIPPQDDLILLLERVADFEKVKKILYNVGLDKVTGYLEGGIESWMGQGLLVETIETISVHHLYSWMKEDTPFVLDNRARGEWEREHIARTTLAPAPDVRHLYKEWDRDRPTLVLCNTSNRSMTAGSLLKQRGFKRVINVLGGTTAWAAAGYPMETGGDEV